MSSSYLSTWIGILACGMVMSGANDTFAQTRQSTNQARDRNISIPAEAAPVRLAVQDGSSTNAEGARQPNSPITPSTLDIRQMTSPQGLSSSIKIMLLLTVLSLAPSILIMTTCFIRFVVVISLLRQALGTQQLPPNQVVISLCLFLTWMVMSPVWTRSYEEGVRPYTQPSVGDPILSEFEAFQRTAAPIRDFMSEQIDRAGNADTLWMFLDFQRPDPGTSAGRNYREPSSYSEVPLSVLLPAYMLSELKTSFLIGFQVYLPFLIIDMVISSLLISMGMMMLPPVMVSLPFKLLLFVLIDGWTLTVGMLLESVRAIS